MTLANTYSISVRHQRSARIDSDLTPQFFDGFVYHGTAQNALESLTRQYSQTGQSNYTLTGPYGSGKSTIALLLMGLLSNDIVIRSAALDTLNQQSQQLISHALPYKHGWLQIRAVGGVRNPVETFWDATVTALSEHPNTRDIWSRYKTFRPNNEAELISHWKQLFIEAKPFVDGILLTIDEMGKTLEYISRTGGELHLFQDVPEIISRLDLPFVFLGLLHQSFSEYAKERGAKLQEEWGKIQGRYTDIRYNVSTDETVALIAKSIINHGSEISTHQSVTQTLNALIDSEERKQSLKPRLLRCLPLHPIVALILGPLSKRRFSQNERSTFAFLNSHENHGLQLFLKNTFIKDTQYDLANLWDYLETNLEHTILSSPDAHAWAEASESIKRAPGDEVTLQVLKAIALLNIFGTAANLTATEPLLMAAVGFDDPAQLTKHIELLKAASCIVFRKHQSSWVIFEGSDIDIAAELEKKIEQLTNSTEPLEYISYSSQVIAKGHYHKSGTLRWAEQNVCVNLANLEPSILRSKRKDAFANFVLLLTPSVLNELKQFTAKKENHDLAIACAKNTDDIKTYATELYALELLKAEKIFGSAIQHDKVALREFTSRFNDAQKWLWNAIEEGFRHSTWYFHGEDETIDTLSHIASVLADELYPDCPIIMNELVNRKKLSGTSVSARKKLLEAMIDKSDQERLGIDGFPPEFSMYANCIKENKLHVKIDGCWQLSTKYVISPRLKSLFDETTKLFEDKAGQIVNLNEIETMWVSKPYGLTQGVIPILLLAYLKSLGNKVAFYEKDLGNQMAFIANPDVDYVHKLQKNTKDLAVKWIVLDEKEKQWLGQLAIFASNLTNRSINNSLLDVATPLVTLMHNLPYWVRNASNLNEDREQNKLLLAVRDVFLQANDPHALLINNLLSLLDPKEELGFSIAVDKLENCFRTLSQAHELMLSKLDKQIQGLFPYDSLRLIEMCTLIEKRTGDLRLRAFARELGRSQTATNKHNNWLEALIAVVIGRGQNAWNESSLLDASHQINKYAQDFLRLVKTANQQYADLDLDNVTDHTTKTVSLILEDKNGKLVNYQKEIHLSDQEKFHTQIESIMDQLTALSNFERIEVLQSILKKELAEQG